MTDESGSDKDVISEHSESNLESVKDSGRYEISIPEAVIKRSKAGLGEFRRYYRHSNISTREELRTSDFGQSIQLMFLGVKPLLWLETDQTVDLTRMPKRFGIKGPLLYDRELIDSVIKANKDEFTDYNDQTTTVDDYLASLHERYGKAPRDSDLHKKFGLLFGIPKDAVLSYVKNIEGSVDLRKRCRITASHILDGSIHLDQGDQDTLFHFAYLDGDGNRIHNATYLENYLTDHVDEAREFLKKNAHSWNLSDELIDYVVNQRMVHTHGMHFFVSNPSPQTKHFPEKVDKIFDRSGMDAFLTHTRFLWLPRRPHK